MCFSVLYSGTILHFGKIVLTLIGSYVLRSCDPPQDPKCDLNIANIAHFLVLLLTVPFEEDDKDPSIWFLDHNYHESMFSMFKRINGMSWENLYFLYFITIEYSNIIEHGLFLFTAKEHVVGWYSTGPKLRENDLDIHGLFNEYVFDPKTCV